MSYLVNYNSDVLSNMVLKFPLGTTFLAQVWNITSHLGNTDMKSLKIGCGMGVSLNKMGHHILITPVQWVWAGSESSP